jgi:IS5 family transposase
MKPRKPPPEQDDLLRARLVEMIDMRHELVKLAALIDWEVFEREWAGLFPSPAGRPATPTRLVAGLFYLQHAFRLSDEAVVARWAENPYWQHFCGETFFQHRPSTYRAKSCRETSLCVPVTGANIKAIEIHSA